MTYISVVEETEADGLLRTIYEADLKTLGYIPNYTKVMSLHPEAIEAWRGLSKALRTNMRLRRYELITFAVALGLKCKY